jgi:hypothetical protein
VPAEFRSSLPEDAEDEEPVLYSLLKATGDLLMLPRKFLLGAEIRKKVHLAISSFSAGTVATGHVICPPLSMPPFAIFSGVFEGLRS